ncbi:MAG: T9SS type A sorting domain-containing protein [Bacteroidales bacterium]|nr:T9SS type A sorting domain-containing protein [Bacteroidales bacterium]MCF8336860.1 T9SS type A sorting domain-containing protein [Bacteroidales bacterium]
MKRFGILLSILWLLLTVSTTAQIYEPEGLNMPGDWDGWTNPPENPVFAGEAQSDDGQLAPVPLGQPLYQTTFHVAPDGDVEAGEYSFKFTSGPMDNIWQNQWGNTTVTPNTLQDYTYGVAGSDEPDPNTITLTENKWYVMNWKNTGYEDTEAIFMQLSGPPADFTSVSREPVMPGSEDTVTITVQADNPPQVESTVFLRYSADGWNSSSTEEVSFSGTEGTAEIPPFPADTTVQYYIFSTVMANSNNNMDMTTINYANNDGSNYEYTVGDSLTCGSDVSLISTEPPFPLDNTETVITFNANLGNGGLAGYDGDVYAHTGVLTSESTGSSDWKYVKTEWGENTPDTKMTLVDSNLYELVIPGVRDYYGVPDGEGIEKMAFVFRSAQPVNGDSYLEGKAAGNQDIFAKVFEEELNVRFTYPTDRDPLVDVNTPLPVCVAGLQADSIHLAIDEQPLTVAEGNNLSYTLNPGNYSSGTHWLTATATGEGSSVTDSVKIYIRGEVPVAELPDGVEKGINYIDSETVTLVLHDPAGKKEFAFAIGGFNDWSVGEEGYMNRTPDGEYFWVTIDGLNPGQEYAFQYYIDGEVKIADPYTHKILDPYHDQWIPEENYPDLKEYPFDKTLGIVSVFQTNQQEYNWEVENFEPVAVDESQSDLVIYEMLVRDFVEDRRIASIIDTLDYLENLGVNAIELMPFNEFEGNSSWGYNPSFFFATDKAYGTEENYKRFIDECHKRDIAVIMDMVLNHSFSQSPLAQMYWNDQMSRPSADNPWYNETAPHPLGIGSDFNHESTATREFSKKVMSFWLNEFKIDGFRFDLTKGFTQTYTGDDLGAWGEYDQSRVDILEDYYTHIKAEDEDAYVILEHLAENEEEVVLADMGMLLWGNMNENFNQNTMGYSENSDYSWAYYSERGFTYPNLIPYMESHDEERLMYRNLTYGNASGDYDVTNKTTALERSEAIVPLYFAIPGPKMLWQFGELGYDYSINHCPDGTISEECRTSPKPVRWDYWNDFRRQKIYQVYAAMAKLKTEQEAFQAGTFEKDLSSGLVKKAWVSHSSMNVCVGANFDVTQQTVTPGFQSTGTWYNYFTGETFEVNDAAGHTVDLEPGEYYLFTDQELERPFAEITTKVMRGETPVSDAVVNLGEYGKGTTGNSGETRFALSSNADYSYTVSENNSQVAQGNFSVDEDNKTVTIQLEEDGVYTTSAEPLQFYPNPTQEKLFVKAQAAGVLILQSPEGKQIMQREVKKGKNAIMIDNLDTGFYILKLTTAGEIKAGKLIVE